MSVGEKALAGRRVLVTRAPKQASELVERLRACGAEPVLISTIEIAPPSSYEGLDRALAELGGFDVVAFTRSKDLGRGSRWRGNSVICCSRVETVIAVEERHLTAGLLEPSLRVEKDPRSTAMA